MAEFAGKTAVVTGAAGGIGRATALELARHGANVLLVDIQEKVTETAAEVATTGVEAEGIVADVSTTEGTDAYVGRAVERWGSIDLFHNNAALEGPFGPIHEYDIDTFDRLVAVNLRGVFLGLRAVIPIMIKQGGGRIVNTSSIASWVGFANLAAYTATKHAVMGLTRAAATEVAPLGIRLNAVSPGVIATDFTRRVEAQLAEPGDETKGAGAFEASVPIGRYGEAEEVAKIVRVLLSDDASYAQGVNWLVDGGWQAAG